MTEPITGAAAHEVLSAASVDEAVWEFRPDYRALLMVATGVVGGASDAASDAALREAEESARRRLAGGPPESLPEVAAWREAFAGFGVKPRQARSSVEALLRRVDAGLPRIDRLTDLYNALSITHVIPFGGEDLGHYDGPPRLVRATGDEPFDTVADGQPVTVTADVDEVVWRDGTGVTCRRWNWRQCVRTRLRPSTVDVLFILDGLDPVSTDALHAAADDLTERLLALSPGAFVGRRLLGATRTDSRGGETAARPRPAR